MAQKAIDRMLEAFQPALDSFLASPAMQKVASGDVTIEEYRSFLKQVYYYVRENPQLQTLAAVYFRGRQRRMVRNVYKHALSEVGHEQLALNDYAQLGGDPSVVPYQNPLPATTALTSYAFHQTYDLNPMGSLGYLFYLEFTPTTAGEGIADNLRAIGVPENAMTWLIEHIGLDHDHNKMMERYAEVLLSTESDFEAVRYAMMTTSYLYVQMVEASIKDAHQPVDTGWNWEELNADGLTPESLRSKKLTAVA